METAPRRAAAYRKEAARLRELAEKQPLGSIVKDELLKLARQYEQLAAQVER